MAWLPGCQRSVILCTLPMKKEAGRGEAAVGKGHGGPSATCHCLLSLPHAQHKPQHRGKSWDPQMSPLRAGTAKVLEPDRLGSKQVLCPSVICTVSTVMEGSTRRAAGVRTRCLWQTHSRLLITLPHHLLVHLGPMCDALQTPAVSAPWSGPHALPPLLLCQVSPCHPPCQVYRGRWSWWRR